MITTSDDRTARISDLSTGERLAEVDRAGAVRALAVSTDGRHVATASHAGDAWVFNARRGTRTMLLETSPVARWRSPNEVNVAIAVDPAGRHAAVAGPDPRVRIVRIADGRLMADRELPDPGQALEYGPDGTSIVLGTEHGAFLFDPAANQLEPLTHPSGSPSSTRAVAFCTRGCHVAVGDMSTLAVHDLRGGGSAVPISETARCTPCGLPRTTVAG